jgi:hypothetical protein
VSNASADLAPLSGSSEETSLAPHRIALMAMWIVATGAVVVMPLQDVRATDHYSAVRYSLQSSYVAALLWYLGPTEPPAKQLPERGPNRPYGGVAC